MAGKQNTNRTPNRSMLFDSWNYKILVLGFFLVVAGFVAMYLENEVKGFVSLFISPVAIMAGYVSIIFAIMKQDESGKAASDQNSN